MKQQLTLWIMGAQPKRPRNAGQAIIIVALAAVALIAFVGLAVDGGRLVLLRREEQNATDAAVLAATLALCSGGTQAQVEQAGFSAAAINGFSNDLSTSVAVRTPPLNAPANTCLSCAVEVEITRDIDPYFISLVYSGPLTATTSAVGSCHPQSLPRMKDTDNDGEPDTPIAPIAAFWGGAPPGACNQPAVDLAGSDIIIKGNLHSNSDLDVNPSNQAGTVDCDNPPDPLDGGWTFGELTYAGSDSKFQDAKTNSCDWDDAPGVDPDPPICGAECLTQSSPNDPNDPDKDPVKIDPYLNPDGSINWPVNYKIEDFRPGGSIATALSATNQYFAYISGRTPSCNGAAADLGYDDIPASFKDANGDLLPAVYYSDCNINLGHNMSGGIQLTMVAEGEIKVNGTMDAAAFYEDLLMFANGPAPNSDTVAPQGGPSCTANGIHVSSSDSGFQGIIFAPNGNAQFSAAQNISHDGCVIGYVVKNSASGLSITCEPDKDAFQGSMSITK